MKNTSAIKPVSWAEALIGSIALSLFGGILVSVPDAGFIILGVPVLICAFICCLFFIKNLITEANVKALEIFSGKERTIKKLEEPVEITEDKK